MVASLRGVMHLRTCTSCRPRPRPPALARARPLSGSRPMGWQNLHARRAVARSYARPARFVLPSKLAFKPPPPPVSPAPSLEDGHGPGEVEEAAGAFDQFLEARAMEVACDSATSVQTLYSQYRERAGRTLDLMIPYEERPRQHRRADNNDGMPADVGDGDGIVMIIHALRKTNGRLDKICACSGFVVDAQPSKGSVSGGDVIITCAHTLDEMFRNIKRASEDQKSFSFIVTSTGEARLVTELLSSMPKSDIVTLRIETREQDKRLRSLPVSPFPVYTGHPVLTHLFGTSEPPPVDRSVFRLPSTIKQQPVQEGIEHPVQWLGENAWRRWGSGVMLGYRSYTGIEVEAGIHSSLPHILTSILPTPGSSGGPLVCAETGAVVGMISGRRMDNRVEGERGWGASAEGIFEMFSLPGFTPMSHD